MRPLPIQMEEKDYLTPAERLPMHQWAEANYVLSSETSEIDGPWSNEYTPFLIPVMDWLDETFCRQVTVMAATQVGKSELCNIFVGSTIDQDPAPMLIVMPREDDAKRRINTRIKPSFRANPRLARHLPDGNVDKINIGKETVFDNMILYIAWSNSPAALADNPVAKIILDEVGKYPPAAGKEADPISLAKKRQRTFRSRAKLLIVSSPVAADDLLDAEWHKGDQCEWWVRCTACGRWHQLDWFCVELDKTADGALLTPAEYEKGGHARYRCPNCGETFDDYGRWEMVKSARFVPAGLTVKDDGRLSGPLPASSHHSCRIHCLMIHPVFQTMDDLAAEWAQANIAKHQGNILPLMNFFNQQLGRPWVQTEQATALAPARRHLGRRSSEIVPADCRLLTAGVDVQPDHVWIVLLGWGQLSEGWLIWCGRMETGDTRILANYELVRRFAASRWPIDQSDQRMRIAATAVDCGYHTDTVTDFALQCTESNVLAVRGNDAVKSTMYRVFKLPDKKTVRYDLNVTMLKDRLYRLLFESDTPGPGYLHLPADMPDDFLKHFAAEEKRLIRGARGKSLRWVLKHSGLQNHLWDASVYAVFAAEIMGARLLTEKVTVPKMRRVGRPIRPRRRIRTRY